MRGSAVIPFPRRGRDGGQDVIARVFDIDRHADGGLGLRFDHHPTVYSLDDWDQVERIVKSVTATDPHFA